MCVSKGELYKGSGVMKKSALGRTLSYTLYTTERMRTKKIDRKQGELHVNQTIKTRSHGMRLLWGGIRKCMHA